METSFVHGQLFTFLVAISYGIFIGVAFDLYRSLGVRRKISKYISEFLDIMFWIIITIIFVFVLLAINWGEVRTYVILGICIGAIIYYGCLSSVIVEGFSKFVFLLRRSLEFLTKCVLATVGFVFIPFGFLIKIIVASFKKLIYILNNILQKLKKWIKKLIKFK